jgi:integrase/recombinase XerD
MFERFLKRARDRSRYRNGPFAAERERYMAHLCREGRSEGVLAEINGLLLTIAERIDVPAGSSITTEQVRTAADEWIKERAESYKTAQRPTHAGRRFFSVGCAWLRFLGCLSESRVEMPGSDLLRSFSAYMLDECGFSPVTVQGRRDCLQPFFCWLEQRKRPLCAVNARDMSAYLSSSKFASLATHDDLTSRAGFAIISSVCSWTWVVRRRHCGMHRCPSPLRIRTSASGS